MPRRSATALPQQETAGDSLCSSTRGGIGHLNRETGTRWYFGQGGENSEPPKGHASLPAREAYRDLLAPCRFPDQVERARRSRHRAYDDLLFWEATSGANRGPVLSVCDARDMKLKKYTMWTRRLGKLVNSILPQKARQYTQHMREAPDILAMPRNEAAALLTTVA